MTGLDVQEVLADREWSVYRLFDEADRLLYVGMSGDVRDRLAQHRITQSWWGQVVRVSTERFVDRAAAMQAEQDAIRAEGPQHNVISNRPTVDRAADRHAEPRRQFQLADERWAQFDTAAKAIGRTRSAVAADLVLWWLGVHAEPPPRPPHEDAP